MNIKIFFLSSFILLFLDAIYIFSHKNYFSVVFKNIQKSKLNIRIESVILCYVILCFSVNYFLLADDKKTIKDAFLFGFCLYSVYELTNYATLDNWPIYMVIADSIWGGVLFASTVYITRKLKTKYQIK